MVILMSPATNGASGHCLEPHDLVVAKLVAGRMKDLEFTDALLHANLIAPDTLIARARSLERPFDRRRVIDWVVGWTAKHRPSRRTNRDGDSPSVSS